MRLAPLLAAISLGTLTALAAARGLLRQLPQPDPGFSSSALRLQRALALNPERRRQAALLLAATTEAGPQRRLQLLAGQGWGRSPAAAVVLKQQALANATLGRGERARQRWLLLLRRMPHEPASADALYALGRRQPLLQRWPAHPAALAAASDQGQLAGALHLARWGARWPGAQAQISRACREKRLTPAQRQGLAQGLAELGSSQAALDCLGATPPLATTNLLLARDELEGDGNQQKTAIARLQALIRSQPVQPGAEQAVRLLAEHGSPATVQTLEQLPQRWRRSAPVQAAVAQQQPGIGAALAVLQRWPADPASWELQWQRARRAALEQRWEEARRLLAAGGSRLEAAMPLALQVRRQFWWGLSEWQLGQQQAARSRWQQIVRTHPGGYYGWRAASRLGQQAAAPATPTPGWEPLASGDARVDLLWRLGQPLEAWEAWRAVRRGQPPSRSQELLAEGRLREGIGDGWAGLGQQQLASLRLPGNRCLLQNRIERSLYRPRQLAPLAAAARRSGVPLPLLLGVAKQESRFEAAVSSVVGATGLLQLMPETAAEVAGRAVPSRELQDPARNALLGASYLQQLRQRWNNNPWLAVASYNAGPNAVARWLTPTLQSLPELWVEAIPYPETRHYVKAVLGNNWSFSSPRLLSCR